MKFRHFRFRLPSGEFYKIPKKVRNEEDVLYWIKSLKPLDVFYSTTYYLNPHKVGPKGDQDESHYLGCDLVFDIDNENNLNVAFENTKKILRHGNKKWKLKYVAFSGSKGFHIVYHDPIKLEEAIKPDQVELINLDFRKKLVEELISSGFEFDTRVTVDTRRIIRLPYSVHSNTGYVCTPINETEFLNKSYNEIIKNILRVSIYRSKWSNNRYFAFRNLYNIGNDNNFIVKTLRFFRNRLKVRSEKYYFTSFLSNRIAETKLFVTILQYFNFGNQQKSRILATSKHYKLGKFYIFNIHSVWYALNLKPVQKERLMKILNYSNSRNMQGLKKYNRNLIEIGPRVTPGNELIARLKYIDVLGNDLLTKISNPHLHFISRFIEVSSEFKTIGQPKYEIIYSIID